MNNPQTYEKVVKVKNSGKHLAKKISAIMLYILFLAFWVALGLKNMDSLVLCLVAGILITLSLFLISWKYFQLEYEYSLWYGRFSVARIYGKRKRKAVVDTEMKDLLIIAPATDEYIAKAEHFGIDKKVIAVSSDNAENIWLMVTGGQDERRVLIFFEADERSLGMLRAANPLSFIKKK